MNSTPGLRIGVVGAGAMGADHIARITTRVGGARVSAIIEPDALRAAAAAALAPGASRFGTIEEALDAGAADAILIATPGPLHESILRPVLQARLPVLCEKPLTPDPESALRVVEAEQAAGERLIQVGFMRRFDPQYRQLRTLIAAGTAGELLMLHLVHRNPSESPGYAQEMLITDSVVHELDMVPWLTGGRIRSIEVRYGKRNSLANESLREPILVLIELDTGVLADVEMSVNVQFGYQVAAEAVFERGVARLDPHDGLQLRQDGGLRVAEHRSFTTRFSDAYDLEVQAWVDAAGRGTIAGPSAWDGYQAALSCAAGVRALTVAGPVHLDLPETPVLYASAVSPETP